MYKDPDYYTLMPRSASRPSTVRGAKRSGGAQKMPKERAAALAKVLKRWLAIGSILGFGVLSGLVALHQVESAAASQATTTAKTATATTTTKNTGGFLNQGGNNFATSTPTPTPTTVATPTPTATATTAPVTRSSVS